MSSKKTKKSTIKYRSKKPIIPKWKLFRANEPFMSIFMWGINHTVSELSHVPPPTLLLPDDFKAYSKVKIDNHNFNKDNMPSHYKIKEYCPIVFRNLREKFGIEEREYLKSLTKRQPESADSSGRSQAKFYVSYDAALVVKTLCPEEVAEIHSILQDYHEYVVEKHGKTLLPQFLGLYRLTVESVETYLIVTRNIFGRRYPIHKKFDLKGSTVQRSASEKERLKELPTYKDMDFIDEGCKLYLPDEAKRTLLKLLNDDTEFLTKLRLMDYSLLIGIHDCAKGAEQSGEVFAAAGGQGGGGGDSSEPDAASLNLSEFENPTPPDSPPIGGGPTNSGGVFAHSSTVSADPEQQLDDEFYAVPSRPDAPKKEIYYIGLVDILTYYGMKKKTASAAKSVKYGAEAEISTVKPHQYARRLVDFISMKAIGETAPQSPIE